MDINFSDFSNYFIINDKSSDECFDTKGNNIFSGAQN